MTHPRRPSPASPSEPTCLRRGFALAALALWAAGWMVGGLRATEFTADPGVLSAAELEAWHATVSIETRTWRRGGGRPTESVGSGVVVRLDDDDARRRVMIATSSHVVPCHGACKIRVGVRGRSGEKVGEKIVRGHVLWRDRRQDLAIVTAEVPAGMELALARQPRAASLPGEQVKALGFPDPELLSRLEPDTAPGALKRHSAGRLVERHRGFSADVRAFTSLARRGTLDSPDLWLHSAALLPGSSGGPLVNAAGAVVGVNTGSLASRRGEGCVAQETADGRRCLHIAVSLEAVWEFLQLRSAPPTPRALRPEGRRARDTVAPGDSEVDVQTGREFLAGGRVEE